VRLLGWVALAGAAGRGRGLAVVQDHSVRMCVSSRCRPVSSLTNSLVPVLGNLIRLHTKLVG
jgi:hypothetical protein